MGIESPMITDANGDMYEGIYELPNGCICCSVRDDLVTALEGLLTHSSKFDYVLVETTGVARPEPVIESFWLDDNLDSRLYLDGVVAVVDSFHIKRCIGLDGGAEEDPEWDANMAALEQSQHSKNRALNEVNSWGIDAARQIACGDLVLLNKEDLVDSKTKEEVIDIVKAINVSCKVEWCSWGQVDLDRILNIQAFDATKWVGAVESSKSDHSHHDVLGGNLVEHCLTSHIALEGKFPLSLKKINGWIASVLWDATSGEVYRCKGLFMGVNDSETIIEDHNDAMIKYPDKSLPMGIFAVQGVGSSFEIERATSMQRESLPNGYPNYDFKSKFLFVGRNLDRGKLSAQLQACSS
eukprot:GHVN01053221.1.p1 GENE.GHVN01053221.1~~GHVN01053221.1.p1  ORF type:complete len:353 (+),score=55.29 GHVN01053221.1:236-1294(+)